MTRVFTVDFFAEEIAVAQSASRFVRTGHTTPSCGSHALQRDKTADVVGEVLEADFGSEVDP